jgi:site-specific DNA-methyltransferase (adenine-specific)/adenine-specific DNA-methyltransferase
VTPKPTRLIRRILRIATDPGDLVPDSFAGSGSTGHAVLQMNAEDRASIQSEASGGGKRHFVPVEMEPSIAREIAAPRLRRAIEGYEWTTPRGEVKREEGLGGGFCFCELGPALADGVRPPRGSIDGEHGS